MLLLRLLRFVLIGIVTFFIVYCSLRVVLNEQEEEEEEEEEEEDNPLDDWKDF